MVTVTFGHNRGWPHDLIRTGLGVRTLANRRRIPLAASSKKVYATGVASSVSSSDSSWPMTTGPAVARLNSAPMPCDVTSGSMPATNANVVIRIGRNRSRLPRMIASKRECPSARSWMMCAICKIEFFFTTPNNTRMPSMVKMSSDDFKKSSDTSANGTVSGSDSRIVIGCSHDSNWAARIRYMNRNDRPNANMNASPVRLISFDCPNASKLYSFGSFRSLTAASSAAPTSPEPTPGAVFARNITRRWRAKRSIFDGPSPFFRSITSSSGTVPSFVEATVSCLSASGLVRAASSARTRMS